MSVKLIEQLAGEVLGRGTFMVSSLKKGHHTCDVSVDLEGTHGGTLKFHLKRTLQGEDPLQKIMARLNLSGSETAGELYIHYSVIGCCEMFVFTLKYNILQIETNWYLNLTPDTDTEHRTPSY